VNRARPRIIAVVLSKYLYGKCFLLYVFDNNVESGFVKVDAVLVVVDGRYMLKRIHIFEQ
jgi:hypothetical protein